MNSKTWSRFLPTRRNGPCPCKSGLRFKHCHGRFNTSATMDE
ncbi:SEC-C metal-binding domain-containing protein [Mesorhizobium amorphae]